MRLAYIIGTYPVLTTTFIDREIRELRQRGFEIDLYSLRRPGGDLSAAQVELSQRVDYVLPVSAQAAIGAHLWWLSRHPVRYLSTLTWLATRPHPGAKTRLKTILHFGEAGIVARRIARATRPDHLHAHFLDRATVVALAAGRMLGLPYSATGHANDIYVNPVLLDDKLRGAKFVATCTGYNAAHLRSVSPEAGNVATIYHGLDLGGFEPAAPSPGPAAVRLLSIGQLKEKKGFTHLIAACSILRQSGVAFSARIVGEGPLRSELEAQIAAAGLSDTILLEGALPHAEVMARLREADVFVLPCIVAADGDRDGIPNVVLEAMAMALPVVSTTVSGVPEAVIDQATGLLVEPGDPNALAAALATLIGDPRLRHIQGAAGRARVEECFDIEVNISALAAEFSR